MRNIFEKASQFVRDYMGFNGKGVENCAKDTVKFVQKQFFNNEIIFEGDGAMKWKSNGSYIPEDCAEAMAFIDMRGASEEQWALMRNASIDATAKKRDRQTQEFLESYRVANANRVLSDEERYEMQCAFGKGTSVVDVVTGQVFTL